MSCLRTGFNPPTKSLSWRVNLNNVKSKCEKGFIQPMHGRSSWRALSKVEPSWLFQVIMFSLKCSVFLHWDCCHHVLLNKKSTLEILVFQTFLHVSSPCTSGSPLLNVYPDEKKISEADVIWLMFATCHEPELRRYSSFELPWRHAIWNHVLTNRTLAGWHDHVLLCIMWLLCTVQQVWEPTKLH